MADDRLGGEIHKIVTDDEQVSASLKPMLEGLLIEIATEIASDDGELEALRVARGLMGSFSDAAQLSEKVWAFERMTAGRHDEATESPEGNTHV
jgi:hypothetical protein